MIKSNNKKLIKMKFFKKKTGLKVVQKKSKGLKRI